MIDILITLLIMIVVFALVVYVVNNFLPLDPALKQLVMLILGVILLIWLLSMFAGWAPPLTHGWRR